MSAGRDRPLPTRLHLWREGTLFQARKAVAFRSEWLSVVFAVIPTRQPRGVHKVDLVAGLPFPDATFDDVYARHVLEHLTPAEGARLLLELRRVVRPGGLCRLSVPDLEAKCREYLARLQEAREYSDDERLRRYRWSVLDLIDQMVRREHGGEMLHALRRGDFDPPQVIETSGDVFAPFLPGGEWAAPPTHRGLVERLRSKTPSELWEGLVARTWTALRRLDATLHGSDPRRSREANAWMYDEVSLRLALEEAGFEAVARREYDTSGIDDWARFDFDRSSTGRGPFEPSLEMEGRRGA